MTGRKEIKNRILVNFVMEREEYKRIKKHLSEEGMTVSGVLRSIMKQILEEIEKEKAKDQEHNNKTAQENEKHYEHRKE